MKYKALRFPYPKFFFSFAIKQYFRHFNFKAVSIVDLNLSDGRWFENPPQVIDDPSGDSCTSKWVVCLMVPAAECCPRAGETSWPCRILCAMTPSLMRSDADAFRWVLSGADNWMQVLRRPWYFLQSHGYLYLDFIFMICIENSDFCREPWLVSIATMKHKRLRLNMLALSQNTLVESAAWERLSRYYSWGATWSVRQSVWIVARLMERPEIDFLALGGFVLQVNTNAKAVRIHRPCVIPFWWLNIFTIPDIVYRKYMLRI